MARSERRRRGSEDVAAWWCLLACLSGCSFPEYVFAQGYDQERCNDGVDNDGDGFTDCDDPSCRCPVGEVRVGWYGPVAVLAADAATPLGACPGDGAYSGSSTALFADPEGAALTCGECQCAFEDAECVVSADYAAIDCESLEAECSSGDWCGISLENGSCNTIPLGPGGEAPVPQSLSIEATVHVRGGTCVGTSPTVQGSEAAWRTGAIRCELASASNATLLPGEEVRLPGPPLGFSVCIYQQGEEDCPSSDYTKHLYHTGFDDQRRCSCTCAATEKARCLGEVSDTPGERGCDADSSTYLDSEQGSCLAVGAVAADDASSGVRSLWINLEPAASCAETMGEPVGKVEPTGPVTYCCVE